MTRNQKLTKVIQGRRVTQLASASGTATVHFDDGSTMTVQLGAGAAPSLPAGDARVKAVRQQGTTLALDLESGATLTFPLAEATSSVLLRDRAGTLEYAD